MNILPSDLTDRLLAFRAERDWAQFHNTRSLAAAIAVESAELLEHFIWARDGDVDPLTAAKKSEIESEVADLLILLTYVCHDLRIDAPGAVARKIEVNARKYPVSKARGRSTKYTDL